MQPDDPQIPPKLAAQFERMRSPLMEVPRDVDESILAETDSILRRRLARPLALRGLKIAALAAAAIILIALWIVPTSHPSQLALKNDINHDGKVDILDAFYLAKRLDKPNPKSFDVNGDGKIDQRDVDAIAADAVRVGGAS